MSPLVIRDRVGQRQVRAWAAIPPNAELATELRLRGHATGASILGLSENRFSSHDQTHAPSLYRRRAVPSRLSHAMRSWCRVDRVNRLLCNGVSTNTPIKAGLKAWQRLNAAMKAARSQALAPWVRPPLSPPPSQVISYFDVETGRKSGRFSAFCSPEKSVRWARRTKFSPNLSTP